MKAPKFLLPLRINCSFPVSVSQVKGKNILHKEKDHFLLSIPTDGSWEIIAAKDKNFLFCHFFVIFCLTILFYHVIELVQV